MASAFCPNCDEKVVISEPKVGQKLFCPHCDTELEVISTEPLNLDWAYASLYAEEEEEEEEEEE